MKKEYGRIDDGGDNPLVWLGALILATLVWVVTLGGLLIPDDLPRNRK